MPDFSFEDKLGKRVCGIDEVGRGPLAGPVVAACVYIPDTLRTQDWISQIKDSKRLSPKKRETLFAYLTKSCPYGISVLAVEDIDRLNILNATLKAMTESLLAMPENNTIDHILIDGNKCPRDMPCPATPVVKGDGISTSIAAASIIAKVTRDKIMADLAQDFPHYGWESNVGYGAKKHIEAIHTHGVTIHHRRSFEPVKSLTQNITKRHCEEA